MLVLGATSDSAKAYVELCLKKGDRFDVLYLSGKNEENLNKLCQHYFAKYQQKCKAIVIDLEKESGADKVKDLAIEKVFCASGYLGKPSAEGLLDDEDTHRIININYANLILMLNTLGIKLEKIGRGGMIIFSSVAGERGRQSNFIYGSAKAGITAYTSGLRNYMSKKNVHIMTVKPGFMNTQMTFGLDLPKPLTAEPEQVAETVYNAYNKKKDVVYVYAIWRYIMFVIKVIPEFIFKKLSL